MEDDVAFDTLSDVAEIIAQAKIPIQVANMLRVSALIALNKADNKIRGIAAGDTLRRLVAKSMARQFQSVMRRHVEPYNFGISDHSGTDAAIHMLRYLTDASPTKSY